MIFRDRTDAGAQLAARLHRLEASDPVVLALPRGGVPVGYEVARALSAPLDLVLVRKIGAPHQPELAVAAVVNGDRMEVVVNRDVVDALALDEDYIREEARRQLAEIERRRQVYAGGRERAPIAGRTAIVVDDGIATGATVRAALRAVRRSEPRQLVLAVPVAPPETVESLRGEVDRMVCVATPAAFGAISAFYADFHQVSDDEVCALLARAAPRAAGHEDGESPR